MAIMALLGAITHLNEYQTVLTNNLKQTREQEREESTVSRHHNQIVDNIFMLKCPCGFCGYCLMDCGKDAHTHVANCQICKDGVYPRWDQIQQAHKVTQARVILNYLDNIASR